MDTKTLKEMILANLLNGSLTESDLSALAGLANLAKNTGVDIFVKLPEEKSVTVSQRAMDLAIKFGGHLSQAQLAEFAQNFDKMFAVVVAPVPPNLKIQTIKTIREHTGLGLADAKWVVENIFA